MKQIMAVVFSVFALPLVAADIYVDAKNYGESGLTGAADSAFGTIQDAVDAASTTVMDTIHVAAGIYDKGDTTISGTRHARVKIDRRVKIVADEGKEKTFLVGSLDGDGIGGFYIKNEGAGSIIEGFTVCNCQVGKDSAANHVGGAFGGASDILTDPTTNSYTVAYCTMSNNVAYRGSAMGGGFAISCVIANNSLHLVSQSGSAGYRTSAYNCLVVDNRGNYAFYRPGYVVNCTFVNNYNNRGTLSDVTWADQGYGRYWNTVTIANCSANIDNNGIYTNCVMDGASSNVSFGVTMLTHGNSSTSLYENTLMGSAIGDYRPVSGGLLDGTGVRDYLSFEFIPAEYRGRGFDGEPWTGDVPIGALIEAATPATAPLKVTNITKIDGRTPACNRTVMYYETWPKQFYVTPSDTQAGTWLGITPPGYTLYKGQQDGVWVTAMPRTTESGAELPTWAFGTRVADAANTFYVDDDADPTLADGTAAHPDVTIQDALARLTQKTSAVINVMPGTYRTGGGACSYGHNARIAVPAWSYVLIRAVEGPANTIIEGQPDPDTGGPGPKAYRCISSPNNATLGVSGFTLTKGYSGFATEHSGGAFRGGGMNQHCYDCVFTGNGDSSRDGGAGGGSCGNQGWFVRCVFSNNVESFRGTLVNSTASSCLFTGNQPGPKAAEAFASSTGSSFSSVRSSCRLFSCTMYEPTEYGTRQYFYNPSDCDVVNCVMNDGGRVNRPAANHAACGNIAYDVALLDSSFTPQQVTNVDPMIAKPERGDFRLAENSPALTGGRLRNVTDDTTGAFEPINVTNFVRLTIGDLHNRRNVFEDGSVLVGAISEVRPRQTLYVDAENGNDANGGYAENDAKRTFAGAFDELYFGDRLVVLPGVYDEGEMGPHVGAVTGSVDPTIKSRVVVPANFTLESRDGAASTVIVGASATDAEANRGCGADAMRAVFLERGAKIKGFTIRDGRTAVGANIDDAYGAGVYGRGRAFSSAEDCILTGNIGGFGAASAYVSLVNCVVTNNVGLNFASGGIFCNAYNTFFADCVGQRVFDYPNQVVNCTFGPGNVTTNNSTTAQMDNPYGTDSKVLNVLVYGTVPNSITLTGAEVRNCVFPSNMKPTVNAETSSGLVTSFTRADLAEHFGDLGVPLSADAPTVDAGYDVSAFAEIGAVDLTGTQRIYNGMIDIGCGEYDMLGDFASKIASRGVTLSSATPGVTLEDDGIAFGAGDSIAFDWASRVVGRVGTYTVEYVLGEGARLVITVNGTVHEVTTPGSGTLTFRSALDSNSAEIRCESGVATVSRCIRNSGLVLRLM